MDMEAAATLPQSDNTDFDKLLNMDLKKIDNTLLAKLVEEVRADKNIIDTNDYNRFHNRHNRS